MQRSDIFYLFVSRYKKNHRYTVKIGLLGFMHPSMIKISALNR